MSFRVLLCCVEPRSPTVPVTEETLSDFFSAFGKVVLVCIFSRKSPVKAFLQFESAESAQLAIESCKTPETPLGKISLIVSNKESLTAKPPRKLETSGDPSAPTSSLPLGYVLTSSDNKFFDCNNPPRPSASTPHATPLPSSQTSSGFVRVVPPDHTKWAQPFGQSTGYAQSFTKPKPAFDNFCPATDFEGGQLNWRSASVPDHSVLILHKTAFPKLNCRTLANVFGLFGNVLKVLVNKKSRFALVEMETPADAIKCLKHLDGVSVHGVPLKVRLSHYLSLNLQNSDQMSNPDVDFLIESRRNHVFRTQNRQDLIPDLRKLLLTATPKRATAEHLSLLIESVDLPGAKSFRVQKLERAFEIVFEDVNHCLDVVAELANSHFDETHLKFRFGDQLHQKWI